MPRTQFGETAASIAVCGRSVKLLLLFLSAGCFVYSLLASTKASTTSLAVSSPFFAISNPQPEFSPSNAPPQDRKLYPVERFFPASRCAGCHGDTQATWSESLHRNAAREPFYRESADILLRTRGIEPTRHCESCHTPVALFSGALTKDSGKTKAPFTPLDHEGVTCSVCHSITEARLDGTGSF